MGRFALLALLLAGAAVALVPGAGGPAAGDARGPAAPGGGTPPAPGERLVLAVIGNERSASAVHGERAVVADPRTGELQARLLPGGTFCHGPLTAVGDRVVYSGHRRSKAVAMSLPLTLSGTPSSLGRADTITPSARPGWVWLGRWRHAKKSSRAEFREVAVPGEAAASRARAAGAVPRARGAGADPRARGAGAVLPARGETGVSGARHARAVLPARHGATRIAGRLPLWTHVHAALSGGFVIETGRGLALWDGRAARPLRGGRGAWPVASGGSRFAWCRGRCRSVRVRTPGGERAFSTPAHLHPAGAPGAFSPNGRRLALPVTQGGRTYAAVIDFRTGKWSVVPGGALSLYGAIAWSTTGDRLYLAGAGGSLRTWRPAAPGTETLPVHTGGTVMSISIAP
jgi:hypothetical protein